MSAQAVFLCVFNVNISLYDWHVCFCLSAAGADAVYCCLFTAQTARNPEQLPSLSCAGTQRRPVLCHRWDQVSQKMRTLTLLDRKIKKKAGPEAELTRTPCTSWLWKKTIRTGLRSSCRYAASDHYFTSQQSPVGFKQLVLGHFPSKIKRSRMRRRRMRRRGRTKWEKLENDGARTVGAGGGGEDEWWERKET